MPLRIFERAGISEPVQAIAEAELSGAISVCPESQGDIGYSLNLQTGQCEPFSISQRFTDPSLLGGVLKTGFEAVKAFATGGTSLVPTFTTGLLTGLTERPAMPNGLSGGIGGIIQQIPGIFSGETSFGGFVGDILQTGLQFAPQIEQALAPRTAVPAIRAPMPVQIPAGMAGMMGRFASRFPNLAGALAAMRAAGSTITRSRAWSLMRQFGPQALITLGFSALAVNELMVAGPGRRRMNPLNPRALSRATRRLVGFQRRVRGVNQALAGVCSTRGRGRRRSVARCPTCRTSPCSC